MTRVFASSYVYAHVNIISSMIHVVLIVVIIVVIIIIIHIVNDA